MLLNRNTTSRNEEHRLPHRGLEITRQRIERFGIQKVTEKAGLLGPQVVEYYLQGVPIRPKMENAILSALQQLEKEAITYGPSVRQTANFANTPVGFEAVPMHMYMQLAGTVEELQRKVQILSSSLLAALQWVDVATAARILKCSKMTLYRRKERGEIPYRQNGRKVLFNIQDLANYLESKRIHPDVIQQRVLSQIGRP